MNAPRNAMVFVYGLLRKGFRGHRILQELHARFKGKGSVQGQLYDVGDYPGAVKGRCGAGHIYGELYEFPDSKRTLKLLDRFEGARVSNPQSGLFRRETTTVTLANGQRRRRLPGGKYQNV